MTHALKGKVKLPNVALYITKVIFQSCEFICIIMNYFIDYNWYFLSYFEFWYPFWYRPFSFLGMVRLLPSPAVLRTASALYFSTCSTSAIFQKRLQTECSLIQLHFVALHSFTHCLHLLAGSQAEKRRSKARFNSSTVRPVAPRISSASSAAAFRFVSCLFPHADQSWM